MATYRIAYDAKMNGTTYHLSTNVTQRHPVTQERAREAAKESFESYVDSRRNVQRIRVTGIAKI